MSWRDSKSLSLLICLLSYLITAGILYFIIPLFPFKGLFLLSLQADIAATLVVFLFSVTFRNASLYDPYWSVIPPVLIYCWLWGNQNFEPVNLLQLIVVTLWSIRLTYNWIRGWNGLNHEDWRYVQLYKNNPRVYPLINLFGIHLFPTLIVFAALLPFYFSILESTTLSLLHLVGISISFTGFMLQLIADEQLHAWRKISSSNTCLKTGLWKYSRHPNYLGEIIFWWGGWVFAMGTNHALYWTIIGPLLITGLFVFISIPMIEKRHLERRPCYKEVVDQVPMLIGWVSGK